MKVITFSTTFPIPHPKEKVETDFVGKIMRLEKIHTIRKNESAKFKTGDTVSLRTWSGLPYRSKQVEFGTSEITVQPIKIIRSKPGDSHRVFIAMVFCPLQKLWVHLDSETVAKNDGLSIADFYDWFFPRGAPTEFRGWVILFGRNFYYSADGEGIDEHAKDARQLRPEEFKLEYQANRSWAE